MNPAVRVALLIHDGIWFSSGALALDIFQSANLRLPQPIFDCAVVTPTNTPATLFNARQMAGDTTIDDDKQYELVVFNHYWGDFSELITKYPQLPGWLSRQYQQGAVIAATGSSSFWPASAGILNGRSATTYWRNLTELRQRFPAVNWTGTQSLVEDGNIFSSDGNNAALDLILHLLDRFSDSTTAAKMTRDVAFDSRRTYDLTLFNTAGLRQHQDEGIQRAQFWLDQHYADAVEFKALAAQLGISSRSFIRRFIRATGDKPTRYLQRLRVEAAKHLLLNTDQSVKNISLSVGYRDISYFSSLFKSMTQLNPSGYRKRFRPTL